MLRQVQQLSWGYLLERAESLGRPLTAALSRLPLSERASRAAADTDLYGSEHTSEIHLAGRIVLNVWRLLRPEVSQRSGVVRGQGSLRSTWPAGSCSTSGDCCGQRSVRGQGSPRSTWPAGSCSTSGDCCGQRSGGGQG